MFNFFLIILHSRSKLSDTLQSSAKWIKLHFLHLTTKQDPLSKEKKIPYNYQTFYYNCHVISLNTPVFFKLYQFYKLFFFFQILIFLFLQSSEPLYSYSVLTVPASSIMTNIHHRMPVCINICIILHLLFKTRINDLGNRLLNLTNKS